MDAPGRTQSPPASLAPKLARLFPSLGVEPTLARLMQRAMHRTVPAGTALFSDRSPCTGFPLVLEGTIRVLQRYPNGRELELYRVRGGESCLLSGSCLLGQTDYPALAIADTDVELIIVPPDAFRELIANDETFRAYVLGQFGERLGGMMQLVDAITSQKLDQRLASLLVERGKAEGGMIRATHQELADALGSVREIVSRLLRSFEERGWVSLARERIELRDVGALEALGKSA